MPRDGRLTAVCLLILIVIFVFAVPPPAADVMAESEGVLVVMYHHITTDIAKVNEYTVLQADLERDLQWLKNNGYTPMLLRELVQYSDEGRVLPEKPVVITFDDGFYSVYALACPLLEKYGMKGVVSVVGEMIDRGTREWEQGDHSAAYSYMTWEEVAQVSGLDYMEVGNHTYAMHGTGNSRSGCRILAGETFEDYEYSLRRDVGALQTKLYAQTGSLPAAFAYPFGFYDRQSQQVITSLGFSAVLTCEQRLNIPGEDWLLSLGRFNRSGFADTQTFFSGITNQKGGAKA